MWHATEWPEYIVKWAIIYGGVRYVILLHIQVKDLQKVDRPFLFISPPRRYNDLTFPIVSAALYMFLSSTVEQDALMQELGIPYPELAEEPIPSNEFPRTGPIATLEDLKNVSSLS